MNQDIHQDAEGQRAHEGANGTKADDPINYTDGNQGAECDQEDTSTDKKKKEDHQGSYHERMTRRISIAAGMVALLSLVSSGFSAWSAWDSSYAAMHSANLAKNSLIIGQRPFVGNIFEAWYDLNRNPQISLKFKNYGKTPAIIENICFKPVINEDNLKRNTVYKCEKFMDTYRSEIFPGTEFPVHTNSSEKNLIAELKKYVGTLVLCGIINYSDQFSVKYTKEYCAVFEDNMGVITFLRDCGNMNSSTSSFIPSE